MLSESLDDDRLRWSGNRFCSSDQLWFKSTFLQLLIFALPRQETLQTKRGGKEEKKETVENKKVLATYKVKQKHGVKGMHLYI